MAEENQIINNWYIILGLEYYPVPEKDEKKIEARIESKKRYWMAKESDPFDGKKYRKYSNLAKTGIIRKEMLNESRREELIKDAQKKLFDPIDNFLKYIKNTVITEEIVKEISKRTHRNENLVIERIKITGRKIISSEYNEKLYKNFYENINKSQDEFFEFSVFEKHLEILGKGNLYEFLISEGLDIKALTQKQIDEKRKNLIKFDNETSAKKKLFSACEILLKNEEKLQKYDEYLKYLQYLKVLKILDRMEQIYNLTNDKIPSDEFINEIQKIVKDKEEVKSIFIGFCKEKTIPYSVSKKSSGMKEYKEDNYNSGQKKEIKNRYAEKSENLCIEALRAIKAFRFKEARKYLNDAKLYWPENDSIEVLEEKLQEARQIWIEDRQKEKKTLKKRKTVYPVKPKKSNGLDQNIIIFIIIGVMFCIIIYLIMLNMETSQNASINDENIVLDGKADKVVSLARDTSFYATDNNLYYSAKKDEYLEKTGIKGSSTSGSYDFLVIEKFPKKRYDLLLKNGVKDRIFKFKCNAKVKASGTTLFIENPEDVMIYRDKKQMEEDTQLKGNGGCFIKYRNDIENKN